MEAQTTRVCARARAPPAPPLLRRPSGPSGGCWRDPAVRPTVRMQPGRGGEARTAVLAESAPDCQKKGDNSTEGF